MALETAVQRLPRDGAVAGQVDDRNKAAVRLHGADRRRREGVAAAPPTPLAARAGEATSASQRRTGTTAARLTRGVEPRQVLLGTSGGLC